MARHKLPFASLISLLVIPAEAGIQCFPDGLAWIPAFAGMTAFLLPCVTAIGS